jgi:hypothetical protein
MSRFRGVLRSKVERCYILVDVPILLELPSLLVEYAIVTDLRHRDVKITCGSLPSLKLGADLDRDRGIPVCPLG